MVTGEMADIKLTSKKDKNEQHIVHFETYDDGDRVVVTWTDLETCPTETFHTSETDKMEDLRYFINFWYRSPSKPWNIHWDIKLLKHSV